MIDPYWLRVVIVVLTDGSAALAMCTNNPHLFAWGRDDRR